MTYHKSNANQNLQGTAEEHRRSMEFEDAHCHHWTFNGHIMAMSRNGTGPSGPGWMGKGEEGIAARGMEGNIPDIAT